MSGLAGKWNMVVHTYMGDQYATHEYEVNGDVLTGKVTDGSNGNVAEIQNGKVDGAKFTYTFALKIPIGDLEFTIEGALQEDGTLKGVSTNAMGSFDFDAARA